jgi:hypothetical protein
MTPLKLLRRPCLSRLDMATTTAATTSRVRVMARMVMGTPALGALRLRIRLQGRPAGLCAAGTTRGARGMALTCATNFSNFFLRSFPPLAFARV